MAEYPIIMKQKNDQGDYDTLYPKTLGSQVEGMTLDQVSGNLASSRIEGSIPSGQITGTFPASQISYDNSQTSSIISSNQVQGAIDELFTSVSDGKTQIASAITDKGVSTSASDSFSQMATNIGKIETTPKIRSQTYNLTNNKCTIDRGYKLWENCFVMPNIFYMRWRTNYSSETGSYYRNYISQIELNSENGLLILPDIAYYAGSFDYAIIEPTEIQVYYLD